MSNTIIHNPYGGPACVEDESLRGALPILASRWSDYDGKLLYLADLGDGSEWYSEEVLQGVNIDVASMLEEALL